jgi:hypothetical protein
MYQAALAASRISFSPEGHHSNGEVADAKVMDDGIEVLPHPYPPV